MAEIRKIARRTALSEFRQFSPQGGTFMGMMAETAKAAYAMLEPVAIDKMKREGLEAGQAYGQQQFPISSSGSTTTVSTSGGPVGGDWLRYSNSGATRNKPISPKLAQALSFLPDMGITMEVFSGGQDGIGEGTQRTGSTRHDHGGAADVFFYKDGRRLDWSNPQDVPVFQEIVRRSRANGVTGFGAGDGYMQPGSMHIGFGAPAVWGAGGSGANAPGWLRDAFSSSGGGGSDSLAGGLTIIPGGEPDTLGTGGAPSSPPPAPQTLVRTSEGRLEPRLYSPASGPILQAYNAAFMAGAMAEAQVAGMSEMMNLSQQFPLDPEGFRQAAKGYVDERIKGVPVEMRGELRGVLEEELNRRYLGVLEDRHRDTSQRAANSTGALAERWSKDYSEALAAGDTAAADSALAQLQGVLSAREALPGLAWTPEQSQNVILAAQDAAKAMQEKARKEQEGMFKKAWRLISAAALNGQTAADEGEMLANPAAVAADPEAAAEAAAYVALRDGLPSFNAMPPDAQDQAVADLRAQPVDAESDLTVADTMERAAANNRKEWTADPIKRAGEVLRNTDIGAPPPVDQIDFNNPESMVAAMEARREYGNRLAAEGYTQTPVYLSKQEADGFSKLMGPELPPEARLAIAASIVQGFGEDAPGVFAQLDMDPTLRHGASMMADGGSAAVAAEALSGKAMLKEGLVTVPAALTYLNQVDTSITAALDGLPADVTGVLAQAQDFAKALYAARSAGIEEGDTEGQKAVMAQAWQDALGQSRVGNKTLGGVQTVAGNPVWLPPDVSGEDVDAALQRLSGPAPGSSMMRPESIGSRFAPAAPVGEGWASLAPDRLRGGPDDRQGMPYIGDQIMTSDYIANGWVRLVPMGGSEYRLEVKRAGTSVDAFNSATGGLFIIDINKL